MIEALGAKHRGTPTVMHQVITTMPNNLRHDVKANFLYKKVPKRVFRDFLISPLINFFVMGIFFCNRV